MAGNTTQIDELVDQQAITQIVNLKTESKSLRDEMVLLLETSIKLNSTLGGSTPATFAKNLKASNDATDKLIANGNKQIELENKKAVAQEAAVNKYLILLSKQQAERDKADAKEIAQAEKKAAQLIQIQQKQQAETERIAAKRAAIMDESNFPTGQRPLLDVEREPNKPMASIVGTGIPSNQNYGETAKASTPAIQEETVALTEQEAVLQSISGGYRENIALLIQLQAERAANTAELKILDTETATGQARQIELTAEQLRLKAAIAQTNSTLAQQTKQELAADTSGIQLNAQLAQLRAAYDALSVEERENIAVGGVLLTEITKLDAATKELALSQGVTSKEVGAYEKAIIRATDASQLGAKAVDMFTRQIIRMGVQFLLIGVVFAAVTWLYDWIKGLDILTGRLDQAVQNLKALNEVQKEAAQSAGESVGKFRILSDTVNDLTISYKDRLAAANELKKLWPKELENATAQSIANGDEKDSLDNLTDSVVKLAKAKAAATQIEKTEGEIIALQIQRDKVNAAKADEINREKTAKGLDVKFKTQGGRSLRDVLQQESKERADAANKDIAEQIAIKEKTVKYLEQYGGLQNEAETIEGKPKKGPKVSDKSNTELLEYYRIQLEEQQKTAKIVLDDENQSYAARQAALIAYINASKGLVTNAQAVALADQNISAQKRANIILEFHNKELDVERNAITEREKLQKSVSEKLRAELESMIRDNADVEKLALEGLAIANDKQIALIQDQSDKEQAALADKFSKHKISEKKYQEELTKIQDQANIDRLGQEVFYAQSVLEIRQAAEASELAFAKGHGASDEKLNKIRAESGVGEAQVAVDKAGSALNRALNKQTLDGAKGGKDKNSTVNSAYDFAIGAQDAIRDLVDKNAENQIAKLELVAKKVEENANAEKAAVERGMDTQSNKARRIAEIDAQTASQKAAIQAKENQLKNKEAKADKAAAIAKIVEGIAVGIIENGIITPTAALAAALGAVQLGVALGVQVPTFAKGTGTGATQGGLVIYGEKGPELIQEPNRPAYYSPGVATIANLPKGTKITPHHMLPETPNWTSNRTDNSDVVAAVNENTAAIKKQQPKKQQRMSGWLNEQRKADVWGNYSYNHFK